MPDAKHLENVSEASGLKSSGFQPKSFKAARHVSRFLLRGEGVCCLPGTLSFPAPEAPRVLPRSSVLLKGWCLETRPLSPCRGNWSSACAASTLFENLYQPRGTSPFRAEGLPAIHLLSGSQVLCSSQCSHGLHSRSRAQGMWAPCAPPKTASQHPSLHELMRGLGLPGQAALACLLGSNGTPTALPAPPPPGLSFLPY